jgi:hypothetical protein
MLGIGKDEAQRRAKDAALAEGYSWSDPVKVERSLRFYYVTSNWRSRGGAIRVKIDARKGEIISISVAPL